MTADPLTPGPLTSDAPTTGTAATGPLAAGPQAATTRAGGGWLPLTPAQQGLFFAHELDPTNPAYTTAEVVELDGPVDADRLAVAIGAAYARFEQLRVTFTLTADGPRQRVHPPAPVTLPVVDVATRADADAHLAAELAHPFDLHTGPVTRTGLLRLGDGTTWWWHAAHHVVVDAYGAHQLLRRIAELYAATPVIDLTDPRGRQDAAGWAGTRDADDETSVPLAVLVADDHRDPASEAFWDERLAAMGGAASLAGRVATPAPRARRRTLDLPDDEQRSFTAGARRLAVTWADLFTAAAGTYVARVIGAPAGRIGLPLMNRSLPGVGQLPAARTVCTAMNVLPVTVPATDTVADALAATAAEQQALRRHPFERQERLTRLLRRRADADLFGVQVNLVPFDPQVTLDGVTGTVRNLTAGPVEDLTLTLRGTPGRGKPVRLELDGHPGLYDDADLDLHLDRLRHWLGVWAAADADTAVTDLPLLPDAELALVTEGFNATGHEHQPATLGRRFVDQATRTPDAVALRYEGATRTYQDLLDAARHLAGGLHARGVRAGDVVGVRLHRGFALYETIHAIALLGAVYLPVDPDLPADRVAAMVEDAAAVLVVDDPDALRADAPHDGPVPDDVDTPAYLLFTSGSTGRPKGVVVGHRAIDNRLAWMQHHLGLRPGERVLHKTPISFDVSVWELYWPLQVGATVVITPPGDHRDPRALARIVAEEQVAVLHFVPSMLRALLADRTARDTVAASAGNAVRAVVTSGEALTPDLVAGALETSGVAPTNLYGPTEAAVDVTVWDCTARDADPGHAVPIGRPVWNTTCYVLDDAGRPVGVGATGELWLGGVQLADGYAGRPDLTAERFVDTPWGRLYRTGDLAAWRPDGALRYLGRTDDQVKVRGQRVELGEIDTVLAAVPGTLGAAAGLVGDRLVAWYAPAPGTDPDRVRDALRDAATAALPASFVPVHWVPVPRIPLGTSGKTDRRTLAQTAPPPGAAPVEGEAPRDLLEQRLAALIADVLTGGEGVTDADAPGAATVPVDADFFTLGGDSLSVLRLLARIEDDLGATLGLADAFAHPTAAGLAALVEAGTGRRDDFAEVLTLRPGGGRAPLFLLPPAGGLGWCYTGLLPHLPPDLGVHTVQAPGIGTGRPEPVADLTALARRQLAAIRGVVGDGPFHLAGWSLGGMAAHAVATLARGDGQDVGAVVLLDAYPSEQWQDLPDPTEEDALLGILRLAGLDAPTPDAAAAAGPDGTGLTRPVVADLLRRSGSALAALPAPVLDGCISSVVEAARLVRTGAPGVLPGDLTVVEATAPRPETHVDPAGWCPHVTGRVDVVPVPVTHGELVRRPAVEAVARLMVDRIGSD